MLQQRIYQKNKLGVVLSGGGAKGAYEAGFIKALAEMNIQPAAIAGTSIGALNGAVCAAHIDIKTSARKLELLWHEISQSNVLQLDKKKNIKKLLNLLFMYFAPLSAPRFTKIAMNILQDNQTKEGLLTTVPIIERLHQYAPQEDISCGMPFYVGMTLSKGNMQDMFNLFGFGNEEAQFKKIQALKKEDIYKAIMASAALPFLFDSVKVEGREYRDGCLGSTEIEWGNVPVKPLIEEEKCTHIIVCHLNEGSMFNRYDSFIRNVSLIEVRPKKNTFSISDPLTFSSDNIMRWMEQGYEDAKRTIEEAFYAIEGSIIRKTAEALANESINRLKKNKLMKGYQIW